MTKPRILIIDNSIAVTGALKSIVRTSYDLKDRFDFVFLIPKYSKARFWIESSGFANVYELPMLELSKRPLSLISYLPVLLVNTFRLNRIIVKEQIQLIHSNDLFNMLPVLISCFRNKFSYICHVRFLPDKFPRLLYFGWLKAHLRKAIFLICVSNYLRNKLPLHDKIKMIYNELPIKEKYSGDLPKKNIILYLANIIQGKGQDKAIQAFSQLANNYPDWKLRFVGGDMGLDKNVKFKEELINTCHKKGIQSQVEWVGFTHDVELEFRTASIALNFSESESFSITCVEAAFFGCPMIATRSGGPSEIINDQETGLLVEVNDINGMVSAMEKLLNSKNLREQYALAAKSSVTERFSIQNTSEKLNSLYKGALHRV